MFGHVETAFAATRAEQHLVDRRATKLGPLFADAERKPEAPTQSAQPWLGTVLGRLVHQLRVVRFKWGRDATEFRPIEGR